MNSFANRLRKNIRSIQSWAARFPTNAYRVYDRDIPEFAVSVDFYAGYVVVYRYFNKQFQERDDQHFELVLSGICEVLGVSEQQIFIKQRARQKGLLQYEKVDQANFRTEVQEGPLKFIVNLSDYLDTGLFLDHRASRRWVSEKSKDARVLNLFCYTAAVSAHAIYGGATEVVSVDMSSTYLDWAAENFKLNGMDQRNHPLIRADILDWLDRLPRSEKFDLIFLDPPSFSNSKKMKQDFDVQRDHGWLIDLCMSHLNKSGVLFFSNNFRGFKLKDDFKEKYALQEITDKTQPPDFRNELIHRSWLIRYGIST